MARMLFFALAVVGFGCGLVGGRDARCDLRPAKAQCTDVRNFIGPSFLTFQGVCTSLTLALDGGVYEEGKRCDSAASLGGCQTTSLEGSQQTNWYYAGMKYPTEAEARAECSGGQKFVTP